MPDRMLATKEVACCYYIQGRHVVLISGKKPCGSEVALKQAGFDRNLSNFALKHSMPVEHSELADRERYYLVQPILPEGAMRKGIRLIHSGGSDLVPTQTLGCRRAAAPATGCSQGFDLDEAFADALRQLPLFQSADKSAPLPVVDLVAMGALYGGFSGFSRLFIRVQAPLAAASDVCDQSREGGHIQLPNQQLS
jgi:hypothetical protein